MGWLWQYFMTYRMPRATLDWFLKRKFGNYDFYIDKGNDDMWKFWVPQALADKDVGELADLRTGDQEYGMDHEKYAILVPRPVKRTAQVAQQIDNILKHMNSLRLPVARADSSSRDVFFTPRRILAGYFTRDMIKTVLEIHGVWNVNSETIHKDYLAVFCTLIRIDKTEYITSFTRDPESADRYLPFLNDTGWSSQCSSFFKEFEITQWEFCAQEFHIGRLEDVQLRPNKILPITERRLLHKGPDSRVEQIQIHPDYNSLSTAGKNGQPANTFVLKSYETKHAALYYNEVNAYNRLKQPDIAANIVRFYGCWRQDQTYCILLEFVSGGTLADLLRSPPPTSSQERLLFWRNMIRMLEAVERLHQQTDLDDPKQLVEGVHQDIKPANILVAKRDTDVSFDYAFKLVDMDLACFSSSNAREREYRKKNSRGTPAYSAPECFRGDKDLFVQHGPCDADSSKDMWSLGCVFSLALVWSILGPGALKTYQRSLENATNRIPIMRDSAYVGCFHDGVKALEEVHAMHNQVVRACGRSDYIIHELVPIILGMLEEDPKQRFSAKEVRMKCRQALDRADKSLATEGSEFSSLFRTEGEATPHPETPKETNSITKTVADTSTGRSASIFHEPDVVIIDEAVSNTTKPNSYWKDTESSVYELLAEPRHVDTSDTATTYSIDSSTDNPNTDYFRAFAEQLTKDLQIGSISTKLSDVPPSYINEALRMFTWKLHEESKDPFQWGVSVTLNREKRTIVSELLGQQDATQRDSYDSDNDDVEPDHEEPHRRPHFKSHSEVSDWINSAESGTSLGPVSEELREKTPQELEQPSVPQLSDYKVFIESSESYRWLVSRFRQHRQLSNGDRDTKSDVGSSLRERLRTQEALRKMSHRRPLSKVVVEFVLQWHPKSHVDDQGDDQPMPKTLDNILCLTGSWYEAQATTIADYMRQTWPVTGEAVVSLFRQLMNVSGEETCVYQVPEHNSPRLTARLHSSDSCIISVTAGTYYVSEVAEQLAWLAATLQPSESAERIVARRPHLKDVRMSTAMEASSTINASVICQFGFETENMSSKKQENGACWTSLFGNAVLVRGYPILRRLQPKTGLELSLRIMAYLVRSFQVVQYEDRIVMKGFSSLLVATLATTGVVLWHLYGSKSPSERISYYDDRLDTLNLTFIKEKSLRDLERGPHYVGWCPDVDDLCGHKKTQRNVRGSHLPKTPGSIVIDHLYVEGGWYGIVGLNMRFNQREEPTKLMRNQDYPSLLRYFARTAIVFFDTAERRSWLVDGASALLHLVRNSIQRDQEDEECTYEWVFNESKLHEMQGNCTGRQAALNTLKSSENLDLELYVIHDGTSVAKHSTLRDRVMKIAHWLEILIDAQTRAVSKARGEFRTLQSSDRHKHLTGYDILDVIDPVEIVETRITRFETWGDGWMDLLPSFNATTIFGKGFGDLMYPKDAASVCTNWKTVPTSQDYLCVSVSTLKMLDKKRMERSGPTSEVGELVSKLLWTSKCKPFETCRCTAGHSLRDDEHLDPRQFLESPKPKWKPQMRSKPSVFVDLGTLQDTGAVVFANLGIFNRKISDKTDLHDESSATQQLLDSTARLSEGGSSLTRSDNTQPTETADTFDSNDALTTMDASLTTSDNTQPTEITGTSNMTEITPTISNTCADNSIVSDTAVIDAVQNQVEQKGKSKGRIRRVKEFFRKK